MELRLDIIGKAGGTPLASGPITSWQIEGERAEAMVDFIFLQSPLQMGTVAIKFKDSCFLERKL